MKRIITVLITLSSLFSLQAQQDSPSNNGAGGYVSSGNYGGTGNAAYFPSGIWSNSSNNWIYGNVFFQHGYLIDVGSKWKIDPNSNSYFSFGNFGIGNTNPIYKLDIDNAKYGSGQIRWRGTNGGTSAFGYTYADQTGVGITNADPYSELLYLNTVDHSVSLYSAGVHRFIINSSGNVGIGTQSPSNRQGWGRVLDVNNPDNSKILATANSDSYRTGMYAHQTWYGGGGFIGTESNHNLFFITNYNPKMAILTNGNVLIGKTTQTNSEYKLDIEGKVRANEIVVNTTGADFVFEPTYKLRTLSELETFIHTNKHLPDIAPAKEMQQNGVSSGEMHAKLLQKVEELTLYVIEQSKQIDVLKKENEQLRKENTSNINSLIKEIEHLKNKQSKQ